MSSQALESERVREGMKDVLLGPAQLYHSFACRLERSVTAIKKGTAGTFLMPAVPFAVLDLQKLNRTDALKKRLCVPLSWIDPNGVAPFVFRKGVEGVG